MILLAIGKRGVCGKLGNLGRFGDPTRVFGRPKYGFMWHGREPGEPAALTLWFGRSDWTFPDRGERIVQEMMESDPVIQRVIFRGHPLTYRSGFRKTYWECDPDNVEVLPIWIPDNKGQWVDGVLMASMGITSSSGEAVDILATLQLMSEL